MLTSPKKLLGLSENFNTRMISHHIWYPQSMAINRILLWISTPYQPATTPVEAAQLSQRPLPERESRSAVCLWMMQRRTGLSVLHTALYEALET